MPSYPHPPYHLPLSRITPANADNTLLRRRAKQVIDRLSGLRLRFAADFLSYLQERQPDRATKELLEIPGFIDSFARGVKDIRAGRVKDWRKVRADV